MAIRGHDAPGYATQVETLEPIPVAEATPPGRRVPPKEWVRENLFSSWFNGILTVVFGVLLGWVLYRIGKFVLIDAEWEIIRRNLRLLLVFRFPREETWRLWAALFVLAASFGLGAGAAAHARAHEVEEGRAQPASRHLMWRRLAPLVALVAVLLWFGQSLVAAVLAVVVAAVAVGFYFLGRRLPRRWGKLVALVVIAGVVVAFVVVTRFGGVPTREWGGLHLTLFLSIGGILLSFPLGVLLALGRRSTFPAVRIVCTAYIELIRGVPLITILFMAAVMLGFFIEPGWPRPGDVTRALIAFTLFTAAYVAEIVRGGLQSVPTGQIEAAQAVGLSPLKTTRLIVLPQALRAVIPGLVGQFISLFKDTSLVVIIGLTDLLGVARTITKQPDFLAQGLIIETLIFVSFVYWAGSYWMSRESQRLETRLGVGR